MINIVANTARKLFRENGLLSLGMCAISAVFVSLLSYSTSPLYFHDGYDSCVFQTMGLALLQGKIPYVDLFDHKGPLLYFIDAFGIWIGGGKIGIYILQILADTVSFIFIYKIIRLFLNVIPTLCVFTGSLLLYAYFYGEGNLCEEWMLCFVAPALYCSIRNIIYSNQQDANRIIIDSAFYGFCFANCFLIRPNDAVIHIGGIMFGTIVWMLASKQYKRACVNAVVMCVAFVVCVLPVILYFASHNALYDLWYGLILYNMKYAGGMSLIESAIALPKLLVFIPLGIVALLIGWKKDWQILFVLITQIMMAWIFLGARLYRHYWICMLPLFTLFGVAGFYWRKISTCVASIGLVLVLIIAVFKPVMRSQLFGKMNAIAQTYFYKQRLVYDFYAESERLFTYVPKDEQNRIWNYNLGWDMLPYYSVFYHHGVVQENKIPLYQMGLCDETLRKSDDIKNKIPEWVMLSRDKNLCWLSDEWQVRDYEFISENYECVAKTNPAICEIELWKKKICQE